MRYLRFGFVLALLAVALLRVCSTKAEGHEMLRQQFSDEIATVRTSNDSAVKIKAAEHLYSLTKGNGAKRFDDQCIAELAGLLGMHNDAVRYWVARSIGNFGPRAKTAVPALERVLPEVDCIKGSKTSASGIRFALTQIGVREPPSKCE